MDCMTGDFGRVYIGLIYIYIKVSLRKPWIKSCLSGGELAS